MFRKPEKKQNQHTTPDHRPMNPLLRGPADPVDAAAREVRRRYDEMNPTEQMNWR